MVDTWLPAYLAQPRPLRPDALPQGGTERTAPARDLPRPLAQLRRRQAVRRPARDPAAGLRHRHHALRPGQQLRPALRRGRDQLRPPLRRRLPALPRRAGHQLQGRLGHVAGALRRRRLAQVPGREPRPDPEAHRSRLRRHLLLAPPRPRHPARGDDGGAGEHRQAGQGAVCRYLQLRPGAHRARGRPARRHGRPAAHPPAELLDAEPLGRGRPARHPRASAASAASRSARWRREC